MNEHQDHKLYCQMFLSETTLFVNTKFFDSNDLNRICEILKTNFEYICDVCRDDYISRNNDLIMKYVNNNNLTIITNLAFYYRWFANNDELLIKYNTIGANNGDYKCQLDLGSYYQSIKQYDLMRKYYMMCYESKDKPTYFFSVPKCYDRYLWYNRYFTPIYVYLNIHLAHKQIELYLRHKDVQYFADKSINEICYLCFIETKCIKHNDKYICGLCLEYDDFFKEIIIEKVD